MRVLKTFFTSLLFLAVIGVIGALSAREILLVMGMSKIKGSLSTMKRLAVNSGNYTQECQSKGIIDPNIPIIGDIQMRFITPSEYVVEVVCSNFTLEPIEVERQTLPFLVKKTSINSGIIWGEERSGVTVKVYGRGRTVLVENFDVKYESAATSEEDLGIGPRTACAGYGFTCCSLETAVGEGSQLNNVMDCPRTCFSSCMLRPVVLSFTTQPFFDTQTRQLQVGSGEPVEFAYVASNGKESTMRNSSGLEVTLDFGDGQQQEFTTPTGNTSHAYTCASAQCQYTAKISLKNDAGIDASVTPVMSVIVIVSGQ